MIGNTIEDMDFDLELGREYEQISIWLDSYEQLGCDCVVFPIEDLNILPLQVPSSRTDDVERLRIGFGVAAEIPEYIDLVEIRPDELAVATYVMLDEDDRWRLETITKMEDK